MVTQKTLKRTVKPEKAFALNHGVKDKKKRHSINKMKKIIMKFDNNAHSYTYM